MPLYRFYKVTKDGHFTVLPDAVECCDDEAAVEAARTRTTKTCAIEIWDLARRVGRVDHVWGRPQLAAAFAFVKQDTGPFPGPLVRFEIRGCPPGSGAAATPLLNAAAFAQEKIFEDELAFARR
jgi:hypothetical protein